MFALALLVLAASRMTIDPGVGHVHFAVSTQNAEAQRYFDQGMAYLYGFNHEAAVRSFQHAGELDSNLAMAWWGVALALGPNGLAEAAEKQKKSAASATAQFKRNWRGAALRIEDL